MATGYMPFPPMGTIEEQVEMILDTKPKYPESLPPDLRHLLKKLMKKKPERRLGVNGRIRDHPFFASVNWVEVERRRLVPPVRPTTGPVTRDSKVFISFPEEDPTETRMLARFDYVNPSWLG
ncbi:protein kinase C delta type-like [Xenopus tropicalis]|uniref:Protein kinase C delta type-like n=1 Tax=Xenopus tropicalis TaxID=8364 RepID=A0A8J1JJM6_XENTR|nr:protein kinase C delta type-like [Xenopus tropicalis]